MSLDPQWELSKETHRKRCRETERGVRWCKWYKECRLVSASEVDWRIPKKKLDSEESKCGG